MLHKVNPPGCQDDLKRLLDFQMNVVRFALRATPGFDEVALKTGLGNACGTWLWERMYEHRDLAKPTEFEKAYRALVDHASSNPVDVPTVLQVMDHDLTFPTAWGQDGFKFKWPTLTDAWQKKMARVLEVFYAWLGSGTLDATLMGCSTSELTRLSLMTSYRKVNKPVCPYCDGPAGDWTETKDANDADHWLPKKRYPLFAVHWANLFRVCAECNRYFKLDKDPLAPRGSNELETSYHPFYCPAPAGLVVVSEELTTGEWSVKLVDSTHPQRAKNLNNMLDLEKRLIGRINASVSESRISVLYSALAEYEDRPFMTKADAAEFLQRQAEVHRRQIGKRPNAILDATYLELQAQSDLAQQAVIDWHL